MPVVGIKPTLGLTSRAGVIPISPRQDTSGAILIDNLEVTNYNDIIPMLIGEYIPLFVEFKISLNAYLKELGASPEKIKEYPQDLFLEAEKTNGIGEFEKEALMNMTKESKNGFEKLMKENKLDALVTPYSYGSRVLAIGGNHGISVFRVGMMKMELHMVFLEG
ncbi:hypothetical protein L1887_30367 [Cichorium endivia]|nr:hypothetical protein L1887_30367 [Cichorium endivia]